MPTKVSAVLLRIPAFALCATTTTGLVAQSAWEFTLPHPDRKTLIIDAVEINDEFVFAVLLRNEAALQSSSGLVGRLSSAGTLQALRTLWPSSNATPSALLWNMDLGAIDVFSGYDSGSQNGISRTRITSQLIGVDSSSHILPNSFGAGVQDAIWSQSVDLVVSVFTYADPDLVSMSSLTMKISSAGDSITTLRFDSPFLLVPRSIVEVHDGNFLLASLGAPPFAEFDFNLVSYMLLSSDIAFIDGFSGPRIDGTSVSPSLQNTIHDHQALVILESDNFPVGGKIGSLSSGHKGAIQKMTDNGQWLGSVVFDTPYHNDHPAILRNLTRDQDGNLLFAMMANFESGPPSPFQPDQPSNVHVYKLDTALNVICANVIDGFAENAYHFVDRIIATSDGGYLLVGSRVDLNDPEQPWVGWARKFGPDDCFTGLNEEAGAPLVNVAPNPGTDELRITLNGTDRIAIATLVDMNGRMVATETLRLGQARFVTHQLAAGVYAYIISDGAGQRIASGRWVKE